MINFTVHTQGESRNKATMQLWQQIINELERSQGIMVYGSTPYVGMTPEINGGHIERAQMTRSKCLR